MSHFDADAALAARTPWEITLRGRRYVARLVSQPAFVAFEIARENAGEDLAAQNRALRGLWRAAFPWRWAYLWTGDPVERLMALDPPTHRAALLDFFVSRGLLSDESPPMTNGNGASSGARKPSRSGSA